MMVMMMVVMRTAMQIMTTTIRMMMRRRREQQDYGSVGGGGHNLPNYQSALLAAYKVECSVISLPPSHLSTSSPPKVQVVAAFKL